MKSDIEISNECKLLSINEIANKLNLSSNEYETYGNYKAKINILQKGNKVGKLILVTSINPTPYGEGKTTISIGINDALNKLGKNAVAVLREPSLGPVFGIKGGATGGGYSQVVPMEDINLHFTGDIHAITACNNLLCAAIDNHLFQGNKLNIAPEKIVFRRCIDINDRALRNIKIGINQFERNEAFDISVASEIMAILCLSKDINDLKNRLGKILIGFTYDDKPVYANDLKIAGALTLLLKDAIKPNLVQSLEHNPIIIHGGPFANIAHGCNSIIATKLGLNLCDYVVTEAGFGSDLGAEKFIDIKCRIANLKPNCIVINTTIRSLKHNGGCTKDELLLENINYLEKGICNLKAHIDNMKLFTNNIIVCLNKFSNDSKEEIDYVKKFVESNNIEFSISTSYSDGGNGAIDLANKILNICNNECDCKLLYEDNLPIKDKIEKVSKNIYHANNIIYTEEANKKIEKINSLGYSKLPICIAKTQYSISDDEKKLGYPSNYSVTVKDIKISSGAGFIVVYMGNILTMPGLSKNPAFMNMDIDEQGNITGLY